MGEKKGKKKKKTTYIQASAKILEPGNFPDTNS